MKDSHPVDLVQAFLWTCDDCGRDNFERAITVSPESIDPNNLPEGFNDKDEEITEWITSGGEVVWLAAPDHVTCRHCGSEFDVDES
jgi:hypothetical protein